jgi:hypothetical protein
MSKVNLGLALRYYKKKEVQELLVNAAENKEVGMQFEKGFAKRPDVLVYPTDVIEVARRGVTSFHASEELWSNPLDIPKGASKKDLDQLRIGWDLLLDIDCAVVEYSGLCADLVVKFLQYCGCNDVTVKFSGNKGYHIAVPFEAFPKEVNGVPTRLLFPSAAQKIALYVKDNIAEQLAKSILDMEQGDISRVRERVQIEDEKLIYYTKNDMGQRVSKLNVESFLEIDTILISSRHLYRMPYSLHEKSGLMSLPIDPSNILDFKKPMADPEKFMAPLAPFLNRNVESESARRLLVAALDYKIKTPEQFIIEELKEVQKTAMQEIVIENALSQEFFPPCVQKMLQGIDDGKKRCVFAMVNFLGKLGWEKADVQKFILKWNREQNPDPLRDGYIIGQLRYFKKANGLLPPNCDNAGYYTGLGICNPDGLCRKIKNPVNYSIIKWKMHIQQKELQEQQDAKQERKRLREEKNEGKVKKETTPDENQVNDKEESNLTSTSSSEEQHTK